MLTGRFSLVVRVVSFTVVLVSGCLEIMGFASGFLLAATADGIVFVAFSRSVDMPNTLTNCQMLSNYAASHKIIMELLCSRCSLCVAIMRRMLERREFW